MINEFCGNCNTEMEFHYWRYCTSDIYRKINGKKGVYYCTTCGRTWLKRKSIILDITPFPSFSIIILALHKGNLYSLYQVLLQDIIKQRGNTMEIGNIYGTKYLKATDIKKPITVTITAVELSELKGQEKIICSFEELKKQLVLNATNANSIAEATGSSDTDNWPGQKITLVTEKINFRGQMTPSVRVRTAGSSPLYKSIWGEHN